MFFNLCTQCTRTQYHRRRRRRRTQCTQYVQNMYTIDLSEYKDNHRMFEGLSKEEIRHIKQKNKKVVGKFKDELKGNLLLEFVGLRAKAYS